MVCFVTKLNRMKNLITLLLITCFLSACDEKLNPAQIKNTKWELTTLPGTTLPANSKASLNISEDLKISGKSFCNSYGGQAEIVADKIALKNVFGTKMFCQETNLAETAYLSALNETNNAKIVDGKLQLLKDKIVLLVFSPTN